MNSINSSVTQCFVTFHSWNKGYNVGHFGITYGEKLESGEIRSEYFSIQPETSWLANPFVFATTYSLKGRSIETIEKDCQLEGTLHGPQPSNYEVTFTVSGAESENVKAFIENSKSDIASGNERYTYLPGVTPPTVCVGRWLGLSQLPRFPSNSGSGWGIRNLFLETTRSHCVTKVQEVANIIGLPIMPGRPYYSGTPAQFTEELLKIAKNTDGATVLERSQQVCVEDKLNEVPV